MAEKDVKARAAPKASLDKCRGVQLPSAGLAKPADPVYSRFGLRPTRCVHRRWCVFCPNCGTQNSETASTCTKCGFNLKGAAAPKFKGTMLMTNQQGAAPAPGQGLPPRPPPGPPGAPGGPPNQGLAGTVVGVPPP